MPSHPPTLPRPASNALVILGADALLAARPATPVQLAHACLAAGYRSAIPATWGDELVARECLDQLRERGPRPAICCACPRVAERVLGAEGDLSRFAIPLQSPPVATARYLRQAAGDVALHLTYVGGCPSGLDPDIDEHLAPAAFLAALEARGIRLHDQPVAFDSVIPPDRRRHHSLPGGVPSPEALWQQEGTTRRLVEVLDDDYATEVAEHLLSGEPVLIDLATRLGCECSGVAEGVAPRSARMLVASLEPPRAPSPVLDPAVDVQLDEPPRHTPFGGTAAVGPRPASATPAATEVVPGPLAGGRPTTGRAATARFGLGRAGQARRESGRMRAPMLTPAGGVGRRTPVALSRVTLDHFPHALSGDGRLLPRAYLALRASQPRLAAVPAGVRPPVGPASMPVARPGARPAAGPTAAVAVATPPSGDADGRAYDAFVADVAAIVSEQVERWCLRLDEAIAFWREQGYCTAVLERARALPQPPDVEGLLATFAGAAEYLQRLEELATSVYPEVAGDPRLRDPERVHEAELFVDRLFVGE